MYSNHSFFLTHSLYLSISLLCPILQSAAAGIKPLHSSIVPSLQLYIPAKLQQHFPKL